MNLQEAFDFLNFWINKSTGAWYTIEELENICDRGQLSLYEDLQMEYATSQRVKDALAPFRQVYNFTTADTANGLITIPGNRNFLNLLDLEITYTADGITNYVPVKMYNEDERSHRLMSQIDPVNAEFPIGEVIANGQFQLYPKVPYTGKVTFFRRPLKPHAVYTVVGGRVIVIDNNDPLTIPLEFPDNWQNAVLAKALSSVGINIRESDVMQYAELKTSNNFQSQNML